MDLMPNWICKTCGVQHSDSDVPPSVCEICSDERQYVPASGQQWTTFAALREGHRNVITEEEPGIRSIVTEPKFGIGQRAFLVSSGAGNVLWDCISLLDEQTIEAVRAAGGLAAIAVSHPHYYSSVAEWSRAFGNAPVWIHEDDVRWLRRRDFALGTWSGERHVLPNGFEFVRCSGHFPGYQVGLHNGVLFAGDQPQVCPDGRWVSFMYSYPNWIPFNARQVNRITAALEPLNYDRIYGAFGFHVRDRAKEVVQRSAERYLRAIAADES